MGTAVASLFLLLAGGLSAAANDAVSGTMAIEYWAIEAHETGEEEKRFAAGLGPVMESLSDLPFDRYELVNQGRMDAPFSQRTERTIADRYILFVEPQLRENEERTRVRVCIEMRRADDPARIVKAVDSRLVMARGKPVRLGGLKLNDGDLILVLVAR